MKLAGFLTLLLAFIYGYPRFLVATFGVESPWTSYLYMYGFGFVTFMMGMYLIRKKGAAVKGRGRDDKWYRLLQIGFILFALLHGTWVALALYMPHLGGVS